MSVLCDYCQIPGTVEHVQEIHIRKEKDMIEGMRRSGLLSICLKDILGRGRESGLGRKYLVSFIN